MFSAKVKVFDYRVSDTTVSCCTTEGALVTVSKAVLKNCQEMIRCKTLTGIQALVLTVDLQFIKHIASTLSKESAQQVDGVFDHIQQAIRIRTVDTDSVLESADTMAISRVVSSGAAALSKTSIIFQQR